MTKFCFSNHNILNMHWEMSLYLNHSFSCFAIAGEPSGSPRSMWLFLFLLFLAFYSISSVWTCWYRWRLFSSLNVLFTCNFDARKFGSISFYLAASVRSSIFGYKQLQCIYETRYGAPWIWTLLYFAIYIYAPFEKGGAYCFEHVDRNVGRYVGMSVGRYVGIP